MSESVWDANVRLNRKVAELEGELSTAVSERDTAQKDWGQLQAQLDRAPKSAAKLIDQGKRIRSLEQQQEGIRVWAKRAGWKGSVQLYKWVMDYVDRKPAEPRPQEPRPMSEAPQSGEFWALLPLTRNTRHEDANGPMYIDSDGMDWSADDYGEWSMFAGWLPTTTAPGGSEDES